MKKLLPALLIATILLSVFPISSEACTTFILKAKDGSIIYGRTLEWGAFDAESDIDLVPRNLEITSDLGGGKKGMTYKNKYGYIAINMLHMPLYLDGMNETGLTIGVLFFPGYAKYQTYDESKESSSLNNAELTSYILGQFKSVDEIKKALSQINVVYNLDYEKEFNGTPIDLHYIVNDSEGNSIVIEYVDGKLNIHDSGIGILTNCPPYDWHLKNLRNYTYLTPYGEVPGDKTVDGINMTPFGAGAGLSGLPGSYTPPSRFVRAYTFTQTSLPLENAEEAINQASRILNNFDIPKGSVREGTPEKYSLGYTQWSVIGDIKNKQYYFWTEWNRQMQMIDLNSLNFDGDKTISIPVNKTKAQNIDNRSMEFSQ